MKKGLAQISKELPKTLQTPIVLQNIRKIEFHFAKKHTGFGQTKEFIRTYIPPMRYYNEGFVYRPVVGENQEPKFVLYDKNDKILKEIALKGMETEKILEGIQNIDKDLKEKEEVTGNIEQKE